MGRDERREALVLQMMLVWRRGGVRGTHVRVHLFPLGGVTARRGDGCVYVHENLSYRVLDLASLAARRHRVRCAKVQRLLNSLRNCLFAFGGAFECGRRGSSFVLKGFGSLRGSRILSA